jgi:hypothetical protein
MHHAMKMNGEEGSEIPQMFNLALDGGEKSVS